MMYIFVEQPFHVYFDPQYYFFFFLPGDQPVQSSVQPQYQHDKEVHRSTYRQAVHRAKPDLCRRIQLCGINLKTKQKKNNTWRSERKPCLYFWLQLAQAVSLWDEVGLCLHLRRGEKGLCVPRQSFTPSTSLQPQNLFWFYAVYNITSATPPCVNDNNNKKENNAYSYSSTNWLKKIHF